MASNQFHQSDRDQPREREPPTLSSYPPTRRRRGASQSLQFTPYDSRIHDPGLAYDTGLQADGAHSNHSVQSSPDIAQRPMPSPSLHSSLTQSLQPQTISPTALYHHEVPPFHSHARSQSHPHSRGTPHDLNMNFIPSPVTTSFPSYNSASLGSQGQYPEPQSQYDYMLPDPHPARPDLTISVSAGLVGHPEGWTDSAQPHSAVTETVSSTSTSPRSRKISLAADKKKKVSPRVPTITPLPPRKRSPASCTPCRKKKLKCDRSLPCASCIAKGTECVWEGDATPLYVKDEHEHRGSKDLQVQIDRLQTLVDLIGAPSSKKFGLGLRQPTDSEDGSIESQPVFDLLAQDLPQALVELAFDGVLPHQQTGEQAFSPTGRSGIAFVEDAREFCRARNGHAQIGARKLVTPSTSSSEASPSSSVLLPARNVPLPAPASSSPNLALLESLPSRAEIEGTTRFFLNSVESLVAIVDHSSIERQHESLRHAIDDNTQINPIETAYVVAVAAAGLSRMSPAECQKLSIFGDRKALLDRWLRVASTALAQSAFPERATTDTIRAALLIASLRIVSSDSDGGQAYASGVTLMSSVVHAAFALELHRDPNRSNPRKASFPVCQKRRRLFWSLFSLCSSMTTDDSRIWSQFDLRRIDCHFPLDCFHDELEMDEYAVRARTRARINNSQGPFQETSMTSSICHAKLAFLAKKISDEAFSVLGCRYDQVLALDAELSNFEKSLPEPYRLHFNDDQQAYFTSQSQHQTDLKAALIHIAISAEIVRLNRPFLVLAASDGTYHHSRERAVKHAKRVLSIAFDSVCSRIVSSLTARILSSAVVLGIDLLQSPDEADSQSILALLQSASATLERQSRYSSIARQGTSIVDFLLEQIGSSAAASSTRYRAKRARTARYSPDDVTLPFRQEWPASESESALNSRAASPGSDSEIIKSRRKANRPTLKPSARSESHIATRARLQSTRPTLERGHRSHSAEDSPIVSSGSLQLSPTTSAASAPSFYAPSSLDESASNPHHLLPHLQSSSTISPAINLAGMPNSALPPPPTMFRYYQSPAPRATFHPHTGVAAVDYATGRGSLYPDGPDSQQNERMDTDDLRVNPEAHYSSFDDGYRHS
ncbi:uncharacterized protein JCM15063_004532 [Sporobolomyces koalae]|uniref:uncharacterized protein n=1 Tax=Sporobolomyces koalae TaxID=500713 RepID=UPI0031824830